MNDEVSVADLLVREGWGDREPPAARSRWRVVAVMLAVVIGCGTAAVLVAFSGKPREDAQQVDQIRVIPMPERTTGLGGADQSTDSPSEGGVGGGTGDSPRGGTRTAHTVAHEGTATEPTSEAPTPTSAPSESSHFDPTSAISTSVSTSPPPVPPPPPPPPAPPTRTQTCVLFICW